MRASSHQTFRPRHGRSVPTTLRGGFLLPLLAAVASLAVASPVAAQFTPFEAAISKSDAEVAAGVAEDAAGCVSVAVFIADDVIWSAGYGWADIENRVACTENGMGRTGSISKSFTAVLMMQLVQRGLIELDDPLADNLPEAARPGGSAGRHATDHLSHAGQSHGRPGSRTTLRGCRFGLDLPVGREGPRVDPGHRVQHAAGVPFITLVGPLGITSSTYIVNTTDMAARLSVGYSRDRETGEVSAERATREHLGRGYRVPNGGIYSTVGDLAKFAAAVLGTSPVRILSAESLAEIFTPQPPAEGYGLGFSVRDEGGMTLAGHGGSVAGHNAYLLFELDSKIGVAVLRTTSYNPPVEDLLRELVSASRGE